MVQNVWGKVQLINETKRYIRDSHTLKMKRKKMLIAYLSKLFRETFLGYVREY